MGKPMSLRIVCVALALLSGSINSANAAAPTDAVLTRAQEIVRWISEHSDYPARLQRAPVFVFLPPEAIRHGFARTSMGYSDKTSAVRAAQTQGTIYLPDTFNLGHDDYILLHELVHHMQDESGREFTCLAEREREAYLLQTRFVEATGIGETPNDMFMLMLRCDIR